MTFTSGHVLTTWEKLTDLECLQTRHSQMHRLSFPFSHQQNRVRAVGRECRGRLLDCLFGQPSPQASLCTGTCGCGRSRCGKVTFGGATRVRVARKTSSGTWAFRVHKVARLVDRGKVDHFGTLLQPICGQLAHSRCPAGSRSGPAPHRTACSAPCKPAGRLVRLSGSRLVTGVGVSKLLRQSYHTLTLQWAAPLRECVRRPGFNPVPGNSLRCLVWPLSGFLFKSRFPLLFDDDFFEIITHKHVTSSTTTTITTTPSPSSFTIIFIITTTTNYLALTSPHLNHDQDHHHLHSALVISLAPAHLDNISPTPAAL